MPHSPPGSSQSSTKQEKLKKKKKSWSLEGKNKKGQPKSRQQIKAMLLAKEKIREEDLDAPPNSDAKDDSLRIFEQQRYMPDKEEYVAKKPQIALKRKVKKKGNRRAETVRHVRNRRSSSQTPTPKMSREETGGHPIDTSLFKERASANNSNANSPENSDRQRERERLARRRREEALERTQDRSVEHSGTSGNSTPMDSEGESNPLPLAREPEPEIIARRQQQLQQQQKLQSASRMQQVVKTKQAQEAHTHSLMGGAAPSQMQQPKDPLVTRPSQRTARSSHGGLPTPFQPSSSGSQSVKNTSGDHSTQLALEPEPDLDRVRRQKEAAFMKRFLTALKLLPNTAPPRQTAPRSEDSPSDSSKRNGQTNFKHNMHHMRKHPK